MASGTRHGQVYTWLETQQGDPPSKRHASVELLLDTSACCHSSVEMHRAPTPTTDFWEVLHSFENQSLWRYFHCNREKRWIHRLLLMGSLVIVHDGLYMSEMSKGV